MIKLSNNIILSILFIFVLGVSCIKNDLEENDNNSEYSLPIGTREITLGEIVPTDLDEDTVGLPQKSIFHYNNKYYSFPTSLTWQDHVIFEFNKLSENFESIEYIIIRVNSVNEIPAECRLVISFTKGNSTYFIPSTAGYLIEPAKYSDNGTIIPTERYKMDYYYDKNELREELIDSEKLDILLILSTENPTDEIVQYLSTQSIKVQLALKFSFESNLDEI